MGNEYLSTFFAVATENEFINLKTFDDIMALYEKYEVIGDSVGFETVFALSRIFFEDEIHIPTKLEANIENISRVFKYDKEFIEKIISYKKEDMEKFGHKLRDDAYFQKLKYDDMGVWVILYQLYDCCSLVEKYGLNLYFFEEDGTVIID